MNCWSLLGCVNVAVILLGAGSAHAGNASDPLAGPVLERPTLHSLGAYWIIDGDDNHNARIEVAYRKAGGGEWLAGYPLFRVEKGRHQPEGGFRSKLDVPASGWLLAGSVVLLEPDTAYELKLTLSDPDGGKAEKVLSARTKAEPVAPKGPVYHVVPGDGGGSGSAGDPYKGLAAAQAHAKPGDTFLVHPGVYPGTFTVNTSGEAGRPIVWRGVAGPAMARQSSTPRAPSPSAGARGGAEQHARCVAGGFDDPPGRLGHRRP